MCWCGVNGACIHAIRVETSNGISSKACVQAKPRTNRPNTGANHATYETLSTCPRMSLKDLVKRETYNAHNGTKSRSLELLAAAIIRRPCEQASSSSNPNFLGERPFHMVGRFCCAFPLRFCLAAMGAPHAVSGCRSKGTRFWEHGGYFKGRRGSEREERRRKGHNAQACTHAYA